MRLFINKIVASNLPVAVFRSGSLIRSRATEDAAEFSSLSSTRLPGLRLKNAFSELEKSAESPKKRMTTNSPKIPTTISGL